MAASPGRLEWISCIKPLLSATHNDLDDAVLCNCSKGIILSENDILGHEVQYEEFYSAFVALAANYFTIHAASVSRAQLSKVSDASRVLLKYLLDRLERTISGCSITQKESLILIKGLCTGSGGLAKVDIATFSSVLSSATVPPSIRSTEEESMEVQPKEQARLRLDREIDIFDQMTSVFQEMGGMMTLKSDVARETLTSDGDLSVNHLASSTEDMKEAFGKRNMSHLLNLNGANILVDVCTNLSFLTKYIGRTRDAMNGADFFLPCTLSEALVTRQSYWTLQNDITVVWRAFSLPILEPLTHTRLEKVVDVMLGCLYASLSVAMANAVISMASATPTKPSSNREEELDNCSNNIVQKTLELIIGVMRVIKRSTRAGGIVAQNINQIIVWLTLSGLQHILALTPSTILERKDSKAKSASGQSSKVKETPDSSRPGSGKSFSPGFGVLSVALGTKALQLLRELLEDLSLEGTDGELGDMNVRQESLDFTLTSLQSACERVKGLLTSIPLVDLLFHIINVSFRKAVYLKKMKQGSESSESSASSASDSNTYYEDDFSSSEDSIDEEDEDSEPLLGRWFEETISTSDPAESVPPPVPPRGEVQTESKRARKISTADNASFVPDRKEPEGFLTMAADVLQFMSIHFITSSDPALKTFFRDALKEEHMSSLAVLIRDLDRECSKGDDSKVFDTLSVALAKFNHSIVAMGILEDSLQDMLLGQLGVSPDCVDAWPLILHSRTLGILLEILLLKQQREREAKQMKYQSETSIVNIWVRFMTTLKSVIINPDTAMENTEDVNVEHLQVLLFLFHSLPLMHKKSLLRQLAQNIGTIAQMEQSKLEELSPLLLTRFMLVFEYLLHYFYDPPMELLDQRAFNQSLNDTEIWSTHTVYDATYHNLYFGTVLVIDPPEGFVLSAKDLDFIIDEGEYMYYEYPKLSEIKAFNKTSGLKLEKRCDKSNPCLYHFVQKLHFEFHGNHSYYIIGELIKWITMSQNRIASITPDYNAELMINMLGAPYEDVTLTYIEDGELKQRTCNLGIPGTQTMSLVTGRCPF